MRRCLSCSWFRCGGLFISTISTRAHEACRAVWLGGIGMHRVVAFATRHVFRSCRFGPGSAASAMAAVAMASGGSARVPPRMSMSFHWGSGSPPMGQRCGSGGPPLTLAHALVVGVLCPHLAQGVRCAVWTALQCGPVVALHRRAESGMHHVSVDSRSSALTFHRSLAQRARPAEIGRRAFGCSFVCLRLIMFVHVCVRVCLCVNATARPASVVECLGAILRMAPSSDQATCNG